MSQLSTPSPYLGNVPMESAGDDLFPPVCLKTHWDPTRMIAHILPQQKVALPMDFRPFVRVCKEYVSSAPSVVAPLPPSNMVFPTGGEFYPPGRYTASIDTESVLRTLDHPLDKWCPSSRYVPRQDSDLFVAGRTVPDRGPVSSAFVSELAMPKALLRADTYTCRSSNDSAYFQRSGRVFNNPTKQDRYGADRFYASPQATHGRGDPMPHGGVNHVQPTTQALMSADRTGLFPQPGGAYFNAKGEHKPMNQPLRAADTSVVGVATNGSAARVW
jgi:hypothetical protein